MSAPSKAYNIQSVQIQPGERLAATPEQHPARSVVTFCCEARGMGYWAATQVKVLSPEIHHISEADVFHLMEGMTNHRLRVPDDPEGHQGCTPTTVSLNWTWRGDESPAGSEPVARYQMDIIGTWETHGVLRTEVCAAKPMNGKTVQTTLWESDQFIVPMKQGNACGGKGLAGIRNVSGTHSLHLEAETEWQQKWTIQPNVELGCISEEPDEAWGTIRFRVPVEPERLDKGKPQVRFCEGAHRKPGAITPTGGGL